MTFPLRTGMKQMTKVCYFILLKFALLNLSEHAYVLAKSFSHVKISWTSQIFSFLCFKYQIIQNFELKKKQKFESQQKFVKEFLWTHQLLEIMDILNHALFTNREWLDWICYLEGVKIKPQKYKN